MKLDPMDEEAAERTLQFMTPITLFMVQEMGDSVDRVAWRVALTLLLERTKHADDDAQAVRVAQALREGLAR